MRNHTIIRALLLLGLGADSVTGQPGEGLRATENMVVRPLVEVAVSADSNPQLLTKGNEVSGSFIDASVGALITQSKDVLQGEGTVWARFRQFDKPSSGANSDDYSEALSLVLGRQENWNLKLHERFARVSDYDLVINSTDVAPQGTGDRPSATPLGVMERTERVDRNLLDAGIGAGGPLTDKISLDVVSDYGFVKYQVNDLYDSDEQEGSFKLAYKLTDKSSAILVGELVRMENLSFIEPVYSYAARVGWRWQGTFKSRFEGSVGYYVCTADEPGGTNSLNLSGFSYDVAWYWQIFPRLSVVLGGRSEAQLAADTAESVKLVNMITGSAHYSASKRLDVSVLLGYRQEDFTDVVVAGATPLNRRGTQLHGSLRTDYQLLKWLSIYGELWLENTTDNVIGAYQEFRATLGAKAEY